MRDELIGYLLGSLDEETQDRLEDRLVTDPELQRDLERLRRGMRVLTGPSGERPRLPAPPPGLVDRTLARIDAQILAAGASHDVSTATFRTESTERSMDESEHANGSRSVGPIDFVG